MPSWDDDCCKDVCCSQLGADLLAGSTINTSDTRSEIESQHTLLWLEKADNKVELTLTKLRVMVEEGEEEVGKRIDCTKSVSIQRMACDRFTATKFC